MQQLLDLVGIEHFIAIYLCCKRYGYSIDEVCTTLTWTHHTKPEPIDIFGFDHETICINKPNYDLGCSEYRDKNGLLIEIY